MIQLKDSAKAYVGMPNESDREIETDIYEIIYSDNPWNQFDERN